MNFSTNCRIILSVSTERKKERESGREGREEEEGGKKKAGVLIGIVLNLWIYLGESDVLTTQSLLTQA